MPARRRSDARRSVDALLDAEPKTPKGTQAYGTPEHNAWLSRAYGWHTKSRPKRSWANLELSIKADKAWKGTKMHAQRPRTPSAKLAAEPSPVTRAREEAQQRKFEQDISELGLHNAEMKSVFDPTLVEVLGWSPSSAGRLSIIRYTGLGSFIYEDWCAYVGVTPLPKVRSRKRWKDVGMAYTAEYPMGRPRSFTGEAHRRRRERSSQAYQGEQMAVRPSGIDTSTPEEIEEMEQMITRSMAKEQTSPCTPGLGAFESLPTTPRTPSTTSRGSAVSRRRSSSTKRTRRSSKSGRND